MDPNSWPFWVFQLVLFGLPATLIWNFLYVGGSFRAALLSLGLTFVAIALLIWAKGYIEAGLLAGFWGVLLGPRVLQARFTMELSRPVRIKLPVFMVYMQISIILMFVYAITKQSWFTGVLGLLFELFWIDDLINKRGLEPEDEE